MKKQFFRVKQLADQTFSRAGKTEALSDDLQGAERRIDFIKNVCQSSAKKLTNPGVGPDTSAREKRLKKNPDYCLGSSMLESASGEEERLLRDVVTDCGKLLMCLATTHVDYEIKVDSLVVNPLSNISDNDYPNIIKQKKNLTKLILDMDSARTRYQTAVKHHNSSAGSKADSIKDELEEAEAKVEQCRDGLACEMLQLMSREAEVSATILEFAKLQKSYHQTALAILDEIIPEMTQAIEESPCRPVFGRRLEEHLEVTGRKIALPIELCVCAILELGIAEEGLFRVTGGAGKVRRIKLSFDANCLDLNSALHVRDPHVFTGVLKSYLRELPEPLLTHHLYEQWMSAARLLHSGQSEGGLNALKTTLQALPQQNLNNLHYLIKFFSSLASNKQTNKMTTQNLAIVIAPSLLWPPSEDQTIGLNMNTANLQSVIVDALITCVDHFFPEDIEFYQTVGKPDMSPRIPNGHVNTEETVEQSQSMPHQPAELVIMKRTQSNSSLSDQHSPPQGSPKPATRSRRQKPAAPNPPTLNRTPSSNKGAYKEPLAREDIFKQTAPPDERRTSSSTTSSGSVDLHPVRPAPPVAAPASPSRMPDPPGNPFDSDEDETEAKTPLARSRNSLHPEDVFKEETPAEQKPTNPPLEVDKSTPPSQHYNPNFSPFETEHEVVEVRRLDRGMSKSGEDLDRTRLERAASSAAERKPDKPERPYSTLDRKKSSGRPVPAPRITLEHNKPSIPERPANLPRPHSSSFRIQRNVSDSSPEQTDNPVNLERAHLYSVDKQQVSYIQFDKNTVDGGEKPEKPKKPSYLPQGGAGGGGHQRAMSEGAIIDTGFERRLLKSSGMSPPPPPPTSAGSVATLSSHPTNDSTHL